MKSIGGRNITRVCWVATALALIIGGSMAPAHAVNKTVDMKIIVQVNGKPPCTVTGATVKFGDVLTTEVDGVKNVQPIGYQVSCSGRVSDYLKLQIQGSSTTVNGESVLKTNVDGFGIRIQQASDKTLVSVGSSDWLNFTYSTTSGVALEAVTVKDSSTTLKAQDFSAAATLVVDYQ